MDHGPVGSKAAQNFMVRLETDYSRSGRQQNRRSPVVTCVLLESSNRDIANYWSPPIVSHPWVDMVVAPARLKSGTSGPKGSAKPSSVGRPSGRSDGRVIRNTDFKDATIRSGNSAKLQGRAYPCLR